MLRRTIVHDQKCRMHRIVHHIPEVLAIGIENFANVEVHGIAPLVPFRRLGDSKITCQLLQIPILDCHLLRYQIKRGQSLSSVIDRGDRAHVIEVALFPAGSLCCARL
jgi:hypothetical protein